MISALYVIAIIAVPGLVAGAFGWYFSKQNERVFEIYERLKDTNDED